MTGSRPRLSLAAALAGALLMCAAPVFADTASPYAPSGDSDVVDPPSLAGSRWRSSESWDDGETGVFAIYFRPDGVMEYDYATGEHYDNGSWRQRGAVVFWDTNNLFSGAVGLVKSQVIDGFVVTAKGNRGSFQMTPAKPR